MPRSAEKIVRSVFHAFTRMCRDTLVFTNEAKKRQQQQLLACDDRYRGILVTIEGHLAADRLDEALLAHAELRSAREERNRLCVHDDEKISPVEAIQIAARIAGRLRCLASSTDVKPLQPQLAA